MPIRPHEVRAAREALGLSQEGLRSALELSSVTTVKNYEAGRVNIPGPVAVAIRLMLAAKKKA